MPFDRKWARRVGAGLERRFPEQAEPLMASVLRQIGAAVVMCMGCLVVLALVRALFPRARADCRRPSDGASIAQGCTRLPWH